MFGPDKEFKGTGGSDGQFIIVHFDPFDAALGCVALILGIGLLINRIRRKYKKDE